MADTMITRHVWRPSTTSIDHAAGTPWADRPCAYAGCGRPRSEHERGIAE